LRRLFPFLIVCYFVAYPDRVHVAFASLAMNKEIGIFRHGLPARRGHLVSYLPLVRSALEPVFRKISARANGSRGSCSLRAAPRRRWRWRSLVVDSRRGIRSDNPACDSPRCVPFDAFTKLFNPPLARF
jgi:hypothetical protein